ncbi:MAG: translocation/assembly module TamB domain-containing protein [Bryobacterales bacterium]|nr:translocation/assembly module TamB domain-containing protein [Bryobacterales bacterium]
MPGDDEGSATLEAERTPDVLKRLLLILALLLAAVAAVAVWAVQSGWIRQQVQARLVREIESATGGQVALDRFDFHWRRWTAEVRGLRIRGLEPAGAPPLFAARRLVVGLRLVSLWRRKVDLLSLEAEAPEINVLTDAQGRTNLPEPRVKRAPRRPIDTFLDLGIGEYQVRQGVFSYNNRQWPLDIAGRDLDVALNYDAAARAYAGRAQARQLRIEAPLRAPLVFEVDSQVRLESGRFLFSDARLGTAQSAIQVKAGEFSLERQFASAQLDGVISISELGPVLGLPLEHRGSASVLGLFQWMGGHNWTAAGTARARGISYRAGNVRVDGVDARATFKAVRDRLELLGLRAAALGGEFRGRATVMARRPPEFTVEGEVTRFALNRLAALGMKNPLPWEVTVSGPLKVSGPNLTGEARLRLETTGEGGPPLSGEVAATLAPGGGLQFAPSVLQLGGGTQLNIAGDLTQRAEFGFTTRNLDELVPLLAAAGVKLNTLPAKLDRGLLQVTGIVSGGLAAPAVKGRVRAGPLVTMGRRAESVQADFEASASQLRLTGARWKEASFDLQGYGTLALTQWQPAPDAPLSAKLTLVNTPIEALLEAAGLRYPVDGALDAQVDVQGTLAAPRIASRVTAAPFEAWRERFERFEADVRAGPGGRVEVTAGRLINQGGEIDFTMNAERGGAARLEFTARNSRLLHWAAPQRLQAKIDGAISARGVVTARLPAAANAQPQLTALDAELKLQGVTLQGRRLGDLSLLARTQGRLLTADIAAQIRESRAQGSAEWNLGGNSYGLGQVTISRLTFADLNDLFGDPSKPLPLRGVVNMELGFSGPILRPETWTGYAKATSLEVEPLTQRLETVGVPPAAARIPLVLRNREPILAVIDSKGVTLQQAQLFAEGTDLEASGTVAFSSKSPWNMRLRGNLNLPVLTMYEPDLMARGASVLDATIRGSLDKPNLVGRMELRKADLNFRGLPNGLENANGVVVFDRTRANIEKLTAQSGGGDLSLSGFVDFGGNQWIYRLAAQAQRVRVRYPEDVSTTFNAALNWTGTTTQSLLNGTVTLNKMGINPKTDFGSLLESTGRSSGSPASSSALLRGLQLDVQVVTAPDAELQTSLARDIAPQAELRLRGSGVRPVLFGRVSVNQGEIQFFGNQYTITRGDISFFNPTRIEPIIDLDLETKVRGITVSMNFSGPVSKLNASYRSDPPLQSTEIIALLTVGRAPGSGITRDLQQNQSLQSMAGGSNTLLGQAISAPINSRLQRLFGVSRIKIDPELTGVTNTPQARLTVEQQLSRDLTVTYITNLNRTQQQIVRVQWDFSRDFSVLAVRDENGIFGVDFLWRKRF